MTRRARAPFVALGLMTVGLLFPAVVGAQEQSPAERAAAAIFGALDPPGFNLDQGEIVNPFGVEFAGEFPVVEMQAYLFDPGLGSNLDFVPTGITEQPGLFTSDGADDPSAIDGPYLVTQVTIQGGPPRADRYEEVFVGWAEPGLAVYPGDEMVVNDPPAGLNNVVAARSDQGELSTNYDIWNGSEWATFADPATITWEYSEDFTRLTMIVANRQLSAAGGRLQVTFFRGDLTDTPEQGDFGFVSSTIDVASLPTLSIEDLESSPGFDGARGMAIATGESIAELPESGDSTAGAVAEDVVDEPEEANEADDVAAEVAEAESENVDAADEPIPTPVADDGSDSADSGQDAGADSESGDSDGGAGVVLLVIPLAIAGVVIGSLVIMRRRSRSDDEPVEESPSGGAGPIKGDGPSGGSSATFTPSQEDLAAARSTDWVDDDRIAEMEQRRSAEEQPEDNPRLTASIDGNHERHALVLDNYVAAVVARSMDVGVPVVDGRIQPPPEAFVDFNFGLLRAQDEYFNDFYTARTTRSSVDYAGPPGSVAEILVSDDESLVEIDVLTLKVSLTKKGRVIAQRYRDRNWRRVESVEREEPQGESPMMGSVNDEVTNL